jgi:flagellar hook assembly protein FlgD
LRIAPNPARGRATLSAAWLARDGQPGTGAPAHVRFRLYDAGGRLVRDLGDVRGTGEGSYAATWDGADRAGRRVAAGLYFAEIIAGVKRDTRPLTFLP